MKKPGNLQEGKPHDSQQGKAPNKRHELKTDYPLSEKDEIKRDEEKMRKAEKKRK